VALAVFASRIAGPCNGVVQRIAVTLPLTAEILIAGRMLTLPVTGFPARPGITPGQERQPARAAEALSSPPAAGTSPGPVRPPGPTECTIAEMIISSVRISMHRLACPAYVLTTLPTIIVRHFPSFW